MGRVCQHRVPALRDPLEGAEYAGEDQGVGLLLRGQAALNEQRSPFGVARAVVEMPASLVVQAASQHVLHRDVEVLLV